MGGMSIDLEDRARGAIWGQLTGDAACLGTHWIYDLEQMKADFPEIHGFETPRAGHYHAGKHPGNQTHYGDGALVMLESVSRLGRFDPADFGARFIQFFDSPDYHGYRDKATRETLENYRLFEKSRPGIPFGYQAGADDDQLATASRLAPVVVAHWQDPELLRVVTQATRVCQNNGWAIAAMKANALILRAALAGVDLETAVEETSRKMPEIDPQYGPELQELMTAAMVDPRSVMEATLDFGQGCPLPSSFPAAIHAALKHRHSFESAVLATLEAGGDNAGRAALLGAWLGASLGFEAIPAIWRHRLTAAQIIRTEAEALIEKTFDTEED